MGIPLLFHQIWLGPEPLPEKHARYQRSWLDHHPGWELRFWTEENLPEPLRRPEAAERLRSPAERADILRLEVVWRFGGVYVDTDFECLRSIEPLIESADFVATLVRSGRPSNALFGAVAAHPILDRALEQIRPREFLGYDEAAGRTLFEQLLADEPGVTLLGWECFYPRSSKEIEAAHAIRRTVRPWKPLAEARRALVKAEMRLQAAEQEAKRWRRRFEEAEARLPGRDAEPTHDDVTSAATAMKIPRIIHQIWLGPNPFPEEYARYQRTWLDHHPGWELRFWTEDNLPAPLRRPEAAERLRSPAERADILRLELLWRFGGLYVDTDFECLRSFDPLIKEADLFIAQTESHLASNCLLGSVRGHPILDRALDELRPRELYGYAMEAGPKFLERIVAPHRDRILFLEPQIHHAKGPEARRTAYAVHHMARSWKDAELLWIDMQQAQQQSEQKLETAREKASRWRARCKAAEAELERLKRSRPYRFRRIGGLLSRTPR